MFNLFLPQSIDNTYRGHRAALWILGLLVLMKLIMSLNSIFNGHTVASSADGIPLDTFTVAGAQTVVALFAIWAFDHLIIGLLCSLALLRYRSLIPFMFTLLLLEHLGRKLIFFFLPVARIGSSPGFYINILLLALMITGLILSLRHQNKDEHLQ